MTGAVAAMAAGLAGAAAACGAPDGGARPEHGPGASGTAGTSDMTGTSATPNASGTTNTSGTTDTSGTPPHLEQAVGLVRSLLDVGWDEGRNSYKKVHEDDGRITRVVWDGKPEVLAQCGSFQALGLIHAYGPGTDWGWATGSFFRDRFFSERGLRDTAKRYPNSAEFREGFVSGAGAPYFTRVDGPGDLRPGDLVAVDYRDPGLWFSGHIVMIRAARGVLGSRVDADVSPHAVGHVFEVVDCTDNPHGDPKGGTLSLYEKYPDTRLSYRSSGGDVSHLRKHTGAGFGHMVFYEDPQDGSFAGYRWSVNSSRAEPAHRRPLAAARIVPDGRPA